MHHTQQITVAGGTADPHARLAQHPLQQFTAALVTQSLEQSGQFNRADTQKRSQQHVPIQGRKHWQAARQLLCQVVTLGHEPRQVPPGFLVEAQAAANMVDRALVGTGLRIDGKGGVIHLQRRVEQCLGIEDPVELRSLFSSPVRRDLVNQRRKLLGRALEPQAKLLEQTDDT
ncbi:hypothetical protein D3C81_1111740 [compost metagenome]